MTRMHVKSVVPACMMLAAAVGITGCASTGKTGSEDQPMTYRVNRLTGPLTIDGDWDKTAWRGAEPIELTHFMGDRPEHFPKVQARLLYDDQALYVIFRVKDRYVRAVAQQHQDHVCLDSCVEFFFVPGTDPQAGYFNLEMNCGGTMLFNFQIVPRKDAVAVSPADLERVEAAHTLPRIVDPEITEATTWTVEYRLPTDLLEKYCPSATRPAAGVTWRANLYKCADATSRPHWLTWSVVRRPRPDFHRPEFFGTLLFQ